MRVILIVLILSITIFSCNSSKKDILNIQHQYTNELINETSPYLLQHAHNPVNWRAWNSETLQKAKEEKKLMVISIGYSACHWCHVTEKESFEDSTVAVTMNKHFVAVKVDREERPDVDQIYINAVQLMTGSAGWPLNVITLPDGRPVWGGTYFKKDAWINSLEKIEKIYQENPQKLIDYATQLEEGIKSMDLISVNTNELNFTNFPFTYTYPFLSLKEDGGKFRVRGHSLPKPASAPLAWATGDRAELDSIRGGGGARVEM